MIDYLAPPAPARPSWRWWALTAALVVPAWLVGWRIGWWVADRTLA